MWGKNLSRSMRPCSVIWACFAYRLSPHMYNMSWLLSKSCATTCVASHQGYPSFHFIFVLISKFLTSNLIPHKIPSLYSSPLHPWNVKTMQCFFTSHTFHLYWKSQEYGYQQLLYTSEVSEFVVTYFWCKKSQRFSAFLSSSDVGHGGLRLASHPLEKRMWAPFFC